MNEGLKAFTLDTRWTRWFVLRIWRPSAVATCAQRLFYSLWLSDEKVNFIRVFCMQLVFYSSSGGEHRHSHCRWVLGLIPRLWSGLCVRHLRVLPCVSVGSVHYFGFHPLTKALWLLRCLCRWCDWMVFSSPAIDCWGFIQLLPQALSDSTPLHPATRNQTFINNLLMKIHTFKSFKSPDCSQHICPNTHRNLLLFTGSAVNFATRSCPCWRGSASCLAARLLRQIPLHPASKCG